MQQREIDSSFKLLEYNTFEEAEKAMVNIVIKNINVMNEQDNSNFKEIEIIEFTENLNERSNYNLCAYRWMTGGFDVKKMAHICKCEQHPRRDNSNKDYPFPVITPEECKECSLFRTKYISYPISVSSINDNYSKRTSSSYHKNGMGNLVKIRPCKENKTYLGIHLGDGVLGNYISYNSETNILEISPNTNPAIFVPALKRIVYGCESWWSTIESEEDFKDISDIDIDNVWYVKLLKDIDSNNKKLQE